MLTFETCNGKLAAAVLPPYQPKAVSESFPQKGPFHS